MTVPDELAGLRRGLGRDGLPIPAYRTLGLAFRQAAAGAAVVRLPVSPHLASPSGGLLPGAFAIAADACCGSAVVTALPAGGAALTAQLRVEFIGSVPPGRASMTRAGTEAADGDGGLARGEIVDDTGHLLGVASLRLMTASHPGIPERAWYRGHPRRRMHRQQHSPRRRRFSRHRHSLRPRQPHRRPSPRPRRSWRPIHRGASWEWSVTGGRAQAGPSGRCGRPPGPPTATGWCTGEY